MDFFARAIEAVRAEVKAERFVLVGRSMGTPIVLRYAHLSISATHCGFGLRRWPYAPAGDAGPRLSPTLELLWVNRMVAASASA